MESPEAPTTAFYVGHHEPNRTLPVSPELVQLAHSSNVRLRLKFSVANAQPANILNYAV